MEIQKLQYFFQVAKTGSVTEAAKEMRISAPAVSKMIKLLEDSIDQTLFIRGSRKLILTPQGEVLFNECTELFKRFDEMENRIKGQSGGLKGELRLGASDNLSHYVLPALIREFLEKHPKVQINLFAGTATEITGRLKTGDADLGLFYTPIKDQAISLSVWKNFPFCLVCSPKHPIARELPPSAEKLSHLGFVGARSKDYKGPSLMDSMLKKLNLQSPVWIGSNSQEFQKKMVIEGMGYALVPKHMVEDDFKAGRLVALSTSQNIVLPVYLAGRKAESGDPVVKAFKKFLMHR